MRRGLPAVTESRPMTAFMFLSRISRLYGDAIKSGRGSRRWRRAEGDRRHWRLPINMRTPNRKKAPMILALFAAVIAIVGFVVLALYSAQTSIATIRERDPQGKRSRHEVAIAALPTLNADLAYLRDAAVLSAEVYNDRQGPDTSPRAAAGQHGPPPRLPSTPVWVEDAGVPRPVAPPGRKLIPNLTYRLWIDKHQPLVVAVIVFRGTHIPVDWYSNLRGSRCGFRT